MLRRMNDAIAYRGPDGDGFHIEPGVGLGHRRLSIVDVAGGGQPMYNEERDRRHRLQWRNLQLPGTCGRNSRRMGHVFRNRCDTEAVIHAWESWGPECLQHLSGMFAFALWDRRQQEVLFVARDRLGKKPLYYGQYLRTEPLCLARNWLRSPRSPTLSRRISATAVDDFFALGYVPDPRTRSLTTFKKLPAAHYLLLKHGGKIVPQRYWEAPTRERPV